MEHCLGMLAALEGMPLLVHQVNHAKVLCRS